MKNSESNPPSTATRLALSCGLLYPVLLVVGDDVIAQGDEIAPDAGSAAEIAAALAGKDTTTFFLGRSLGLVSLLLLAVFVAVLATRIRRLAGPDSILPAVALVGVASVVTLQLGAVLSTFAAVRHHDDGIPPDVLVLVLELGGAFLLAMLPLALVLGAVGVAGLRHGLLGRILSWAAVVLAVLLVVGFGAFSAGVEIGFLAMPLSWLWFLAAGGRLAFATQERSSGASHADPGRAASSPAV